MLVFGLTGKISFADLIFDLVECANLLQRRLDRLRIGIDGLKEASAAMYPTLSMGDVQLAGVFLVGRITVGQQDAARSQHAQRRSHVLTAAGGKEGKTDLIALPVDRPEVAAPDDRLSPAMRFNPAARSSSPSLLSS